MCLHMASLYRAYCQVYVYISCILTEVNVRGLSLFFSFCSILSPNFLVLSVLNPSPLSVVKQSEMGELEMEGFFPSLFPAVIHPKYCIRKGARVTRRSLSWEKLDFTVDWLGHLSTNSLVRHP